MDDYIPLTGGAELSLHFVLWLRGSNSHIKVQVILSDSPFYTPANSVWLYDVHGISVQTKVSAQNLSIYFVPLEIDPGLPWMKEAYCGVRLFSLM